MLGPVKIIHKSIIKVLRKKNNFKIFTGSTLLFLSLFILLPVFLVPGNSLLFQLSIFTFWNYVLMILLSILIGIMISMQVYNYKTKKSIKISGKGVVGSFAGFIAGMFGTAACSSCIAAIFGFLGIGTVFLLLEYQPYIVTISIALVLLSIYMTSVEINKNCSACKQ